MAAMVGFRDMTPSQRRQAIYVDHPWRGSAVLLVIGLLPMALLGFALTGRLVFFPVVVVTGLVLYPWLVIRAKREKLSQTVEGTQFDPQVHSRTALYGGDTDEDDILRP